ncbi:hypothetical protein J8V44_13825 [Photorhabdus bodei]|nr:hypothetical protein [Photorhabdus bodei]MCC8465513.1 hypothetical protein [Photorhabdus bodei]
MTGVSECSQQRGNLKDNGYTLVTPTGRYNCYLCSACISEEIIDRDSNT